MPIELPDQSESARMSAPNSIPFRRKNCSRYRRSSFINSGVNRAVPRKDEAVRRRAIVLHIVVRKISLSKLNRLSTTSTSSKSFFLNRQLEIRYRHFAIWLRPVTRKSVVTGRVPCAAFEIPGLFFLKTAVHPRQPRQAPVFTPQRAVLRNHPLGEARSSCAAQLLGPLTAVPNTGFRVTAPSLRA